MLNGFASTNLMKWTSFSLTVPFKQIAQFIRTPLACFLFPILCLAHIPVGLTQSSTGAAVVHQTLTEQKVDKLVQHSIQLYQSKNFAAAAQGGEPADTTQNKLLL